MKNKVFLNSKNFYIFLNKCNKKYNDVIATKIRLYSKTFTGTHTHTHTYRNKTDNSKYKVKNTVQNNPMKIIVLKILSLGNKNEA